MILKPHWIQECLCTPHAVHTADGHRNRTKCPDIPGTIKVVRSGPDSDSGSSIGPGSGEKAVICMFAQWAPGKSGVCARSYPAPPLMQADDAVGRLGWFKACLDLIDALGLDAVAIPDHIGCGLAGGDWFRYKTPVEASTTRFTVYNIYTLTYRMFFIPIKKLVNIYVHAKV